MPGLANIVYTIAANARITFSAKPARNITGIRWR